LFADAAHAYKRVRRYTPGVVPAAGQCSVNYGTTSDSVSYGGGPILANVQAIPVFWGSNVDPAITSWAQGYLETLVTSAYMDLLAQYSTTGQSGGTNQTLGHGSAPAGVTITPTMATGTIMDSQIASELASQVAAGHLSTTKDAQGHPNTLFVVFFPPGVAISDGTGTSCTDFCGYHAAQSGSFAYAVIPDMGPGSGCATGCSDQCTSGNVDVSLGTVSHEVAEAVTDPDNPPGWVNPSQQSQNSEIGDICTSTGPTQTDTGPVPGTNILAQYEWSQRDGQCLLANPGGTGSSSGSGSSGSSSGGSSGSGSGSGSTSSSSGSSGGSSGGTGSGGGGSNGSSSGSGSGGGSPIGSSSGSGVGLDAGASTDAGGDAADNQDSSRSSSSGCGCTAPGRSTDAASLVALAGLTLLVSSRRRARRSS
jgi:hypothetical protein